MNPSSPEEPLNDATVKARAFAVEMNKRNRDFWNCQSYVFERMAARYPRRLISAIRSAERTANVRGIKHVESIESLLNKRVSRQERRGWEGGRAKKLRYSESHVFFQALFRTWNSDPSQYTDIADFCTDAAERIKLTLGVDVKPSSIRQWMKDMQFRRPRPSRIGG